MALTQRLEIRQSHALVMTPQLMQAIKLLQLSNLDLATYVDNELERNPLLERPGDGEADGERRAGDREPTSGADAQPAPWTEDTPLDRPGVVESRAAAELDEGAGADSDAAASRANADSPQSYADWGSGGGARREDGDYNLEAFVSVETTLTDHLAEQLM